MHKSTELLVSLAAAIIAFCALLTSTWQGCETREFYRLSTKPIIVYEWKIREGQKSGLYIQNNGFGPAILRDIEFNYDGKLIQSKNNSKWDTVTNMINKNGGRVIHNYFNPGDSTKDWRNTKRRR